MVVLIIFLTIGLSSFCILRRRRRSEKAAAASNRSARRDKGHGTHLYFQQKAELDNKSLKLQRKTIEHTYELEDENRIPELEDDDRILELEDENRIHELDGEDRIPELPGEEKRQKFTCKQDFGTSDRA